MTETTSETNVHGWTLHVHVRGMCTVWILKVKGMYKGRTLQVREMYRGWTLHVRRERYVQGTDITSERNE